MLFIDYQSLVVLDYQRKRDANALHLSLIQPTPASLREACMAVCNNRYARKDEQVLMAFFEEGRDKGACLKAIEACEIDRFRPLINFLKKPSIKTDPKNVALLAWLIDFEPRPFKVQNDYEFPGMDGGKRGEPPKGKNGETVDSTKEPITESIKEPTTVPPDVNGKEGPPTSTPFPIPAPKRRVPMFKTRNVIGAVVVIVLLGLAINWGGGKKSPIMATLGPQTCMYWTGEHYQQVSCNQKLGDTLVVALDSEKLAHFKRITLPDTITQNSVGVVWYVKVKGEIEYYTSGGYHPIDPKLRLKPITAYMIRKHLHSNQEAEQISK